MKVSLYSGQSSLWNQNCPGISACIIDSPWQASIGKLNLRFTLFLNILNSFFTQKYVNNGAFLYVIKSKSILEDVMENGAS